jgi:hypothetical protein
MPDVRTATDSGTEVCMMEDRGADRPVAARAAQVNFNALLCAPRARIAVARIVVPNGGYARGYHELRTPLAA